jgi:hypothetical protein
MAKPAPTPIPTNKYTLLDEELTCTIENTESGAESPKDHNIIENNTSVQTNIDSTPSVENVQKQIRIMENQNRLRNLKNRAQDEKDKRWSAFKKAPGIQTSVKNTEKGEKGSNGVMAQSSNANHNVGQCQEEEAPKGYRPYPWVPDLPYTEDTPPEGRDAGCWTGERWVRTRVPFGLKKMEAAKWLARRAMGISEMRLEQELREFQKLRQHHEMQVPIMLTSPDTGKTRTIKALLDNGCTTTCID